MIKSAITVSLVPEARGGPFVFWDNLESACTQAASLGFHGIEIFPGHADELHGMHLREMLRAHDLELAAIGTGAGWVKHRLTLTDAEPHVRLRARDFAGAVIDFAGGFGAPAIVGSMQGRWGGSVSREQALEWFAEELNQLGPRALALGVPLLFEPLNRYETNMFNSVADALGFLDRLKTSNIKLLCDVFHMNIEEADIPASLRQAGQRLGHVHFADSNRRAVGMGHMDYTGIVSALHEMGYQGFVSAEILPLPDSETAARQTAAAYRKWFGKLNREPAIVLVP
jgi:sugar phosphate isomerase/epimerase